MQEDKTTKLDKSTKFLKVDSSFIVVLTFYEYDSLLSWFKANSNLQKKELTMQRLLLLISFLMLLGACASLTPEQEAARRIDAVKCEHEGGKVYLGVNRSQPWSYYECVSRPEQKRLERLELACVSAGGTVLYETGKRKFRNCKKEGTKVKVNVQNNSNPIPMPSGCLGYSCKGRY